MRELRRGAVILGLVAVGVMAGCGGSNDCTVTPPLAQGPSACSGAPGTNLTVNVNWCTCGSTVECDVRDEGGGVIQLEPKITSCDANCPGNPSDCPAQPVKCQVTVPNSGSSYHVYVFGAQNQNGYVDIPLTVSGGASNTCS